MAVGSRSEKTAESTHQDASSWRETEKVIRLELTVGLVLCRGLVF